MTLHLDNDLVRPVAISGQYLDFCTAKLHNHLSSLIGYFPVTYLVTPVNIELQVIFDEGEYHGC